MPVDAVHTTRLTYARSAAADNLPVSVTYSGTTGFRYLSCRPDEYLLKTGLGVRAEQHVGKKTCAAALSFGMAMQVSGAPV